MKKNYYNSDETVKLNNYNAKLLHNDLKNKKGYILFKSIINCNKFLNDWCLSNDCIISNETNCIILQVPGCLTIPFYCEIYMKDAI